MDIKKFYKTVLILVIPIALQNLINVGITATDVVMLGAVSEKALAGASLGGQVQFIMTLILFGLSSGGSVLIAQYWGKHDIVTIEKVLGIAVKVAFVVSVIFAIAAYVIPEPIMRLLTSDEDVIKEGVRYLRVVCFSYVFNALTMVYLNTLRSVEKVVISTFVYFISLLINIIFNYTFIFGKFGAPQLGVSGAAIATLIARIVEFLIVVGYDRFANKIFKFKFKLLFNKDRMLSRDFRTFSVPVIANELIWGSGVAVVAAILGHMGSAASASNSVAQVMRQLATVVSLGIASATAIMIGKAIGEGKEDLAKIYGHRFAILSIVAGIAGGIVILIARPFVLSGMALSEEAKYYLSIMMFVMSYFVIAQAYNTDLIVGIFRAGGDTKYGLFVDVTFLWGVSILFGIIAAFVFDCTVPIVYVILLSDEIFKIPFTTMRYKSYKWLKNVTR